MQILMTILLIFIGIFLFGFVIFFHEFGHFFTAKLSGIRVNEFAIGMGPKIFGFKKGETQYTLRLIPMGGYCAMEGEDEESEDESSFGSKPIWKRAIVISAGAILNIILGLVLTAVMLVQQPMFATSQISEFTENSALHSAGVQEDDIIKKIDGYRVYGDRDLSFALAMANPDSVDFEVLRDGKVLQLDDVKMNSTEGSNGKRIVSLDFRVYGEKKTAGSVLKRTFTDTFSTCRMVVATLKGLVTGRFGINEIAGPVGTVQIISQAASEGLKVSFGAAVNNILMMIIVITVNLGIFNLLPLPALDGGRLFFLLIEAIFRKPIPAKYEGYVHTAGFVILIGFMVFVSFHDILRIVRGG